MADHLRDSVRNIAESYKGIAALAGAFIAGTMVMGFASGFLQLPEKVEVVEATAAADRAALRAELIEFQSSSDARHEAQEEQLRVILQWAENLNQYTCVLTVRIEGGDLGACRSTPGVGAPGQ